MGHEFQRRWDAGLSVSTDVSGLGVRLSAPRREREREKEKSKGTLAGGENWSDRMFFHVRREKNVVLEPRHFGARMKDVIMEKIKLEMEGTCSGRYGFIVCITHIENVSEGIITDDGTARAKFAVEYDCVAYRPFKNEVLDAVVTQVNKFGFFAEAGPLQLFVSNSLVPDDVKYVTDENCYKSDDGQITIGVDCEVRVKIVGMRIDANDIFCIATIKEDYLGLIGYAEGDAAVGAV